MPVLKLSVNEMEKNIRMFFLFLLITMKLCAMSGKTLFDRSMIPKKNGKGTFDLSEHDKYLENKIK